MSQTQGPSVTDKDQRRDSSGEPGVDRQHLRNYEQLRRSVTDRKVAGVAGGLGRHLDIDPTVLRVLLVVLCFFGGAGFVLYGVAWLVVPKDGRAEGTVFMKAATRNAVLIGAGVLAALLAFGGGIGRFGFPWPVVVVGLGVALYLALRDKQGPPPAPGPEAMTPPTAQPVTPWTPPAPRRTGLLLFGPTLALVALALGVLGLVDASGVDVAASAYPALALAVVGVMLVIGSIVGRAGGLVLLGVLAALSLGVTSAAEAAGLDGSVISGDSRQLDAGPTSASAVRDAYTVGTGQVSLDLSQVADAAALAGRTIDVRAQVGELDVTLPRGVRSRVVASIHGPGQIDLPGRESDGFGTNLGGTYGSGAGSVVIDTHLSIGHIVVRNP